MQKVEGSSPFSRFAKTPQMRGFCLMEVVVDKLCPKILSQVWRAYCLL